MSRQFHAGRSKFRGEGGGRSSNQSSQYNNRNNDGGNRNNSSQPKLLFHPQTKDGGYATYATVLEEITSYGQQTYGDDSGYVLESLENDKEKTFTEPQPGAIPVPKGDKDGKLTDVEEMECEAKKDAMSIKYHVKMEIYEKETKSYANAMRKLYSDIMKNHCSRTMQQKVETHPDFQSTDANRKIENSPLKLLAVIKELVHDHARAQYHFASGWTSLQRFASMRQEENEHIIDYHKRFKQSRDVIKTQLGPKVFETWVRHSEKYRKEKDNAEKQKMIDNSFDQACAYRFIDGADTVSYTHLTLPTIYSV